MHFIRPKSYHWANFICDTIFSVSFKSKISVNTQYFFVSSLLFVAFNLHSKVRRAAT